MAMPQRIIQAACYTVTLAMGFFIGLNFKKPIASQLASHGKSPIGATRAPSIFPDAQPESAAPNEVEETKSILNQPKESAEPTELIVPTLLLDSLDFTFQMRSGRLTGDAQEILKTSEKERALVNEILEEVSDNIKQAEFDTREILSKSDDSIVIQTSLHRETIENTIVEYYPQLVAVLGEKRGMLCGVLAKVSLADRFGAYDDRKIEVFTKGDSFKIIEHNGQNRSIFESVKDIPFKYRHLIRIE